MNNAPLAARALAGSAPGDHICVSFGSDAEHQAVLGRHARDALRRGAQFFYFADASDAATVRAYLDAEGIDTEACLASGQLEIRRWFVPDCDFDVDAMVRSFEDLKRATIAGGYSALVGASEMSWALARPGDETRLLQYERAVNRAFAAADGIGVCLYDRRLFAAEQLAPLEAAHSYRLCTHEHSTTTVRRRLVVTERDARTVALAGELDLDAAPYLEARLAEVDGDGDVVIETADLRFVDISGCRTLIGAAERLYDGRRVLLPDVSAALLRVLRICGWDSHPRLGLA